MSGYLTAGWSNLAVTGAGAAGALTGLLFVAVSINLRRILEFPQLPDRAAGTLALVMTILLTCLLMLAPRGRASLARDHGDRGPAYWVLSALLILLLPALLLAGGGISLLAGGSGGLYWVLAGI